MIILTLFFSTLNLSTFAASDSISCTLTDLKSLCSQIPQSDQTYIELQDGRFMVNPRRKEDTVPRFSRVQLRRGRQNINSQFNDVKRKFTAYLNELGSTMANRSVIDNLIKRISSVSLTITNLQCKSSLTGNGHYNTVSHSIELCPYSGLMPRAQLTNLITHEIAHSIDACNMQSELYKINGTLPARSNTQNNPFYSQLISSKYVSRVSHEAEPYIRELFPLIDQGIRSGSLNLVASPISVSDFPLKNVMSCMSQKNLISKDAATPKAGDQCSNGTLSETPSDLWATKIMGLSLGQSSSSKPEDKLSLLSKATIDLLCRPRIDKVTGRSLSELPTRGLPVTDRYISDRYRDELTILSDSNIQKAMGCQPVPRYGNCVSNMDYHIRAQLGSSTSQPEPIINQSNQ